MKYKGQKDSIVLFLLKTKTINNPGGIPHYYRTITYNEKVGGKVTGIYIFLDTGLFWDLSYVRNKDHKKFDFKLMDWNVDGFDAPFSKTPCF